MGNKLQLLRDCLVEMTTKNQEQYVEIQKLLNEIDELKLENKGLKQKIRMKDYIIKKGSK